jgi:uncharacterized protein YutE (UPF0331/DUF86 family)
MIGFRDLLHQYGKIDDHRAFIHLSNERKDFCEFIAVIHEFIKENEKE